MINLQDLERAFAPIAEIGQEEMTFEASGRSLTIRQVLPDEEVEVNKYARIALDEVGSEGSDSDKEAALQRFLDRFKVGILCHSIVQIDDMDLRALEFIPTGEVLDNGVPVRIPKFKAMEKIIKPWTRQVLNAVFTKYGELTNRIELKAEKVITFNPTDLDAEIDRVKARLTDLKKAKSEQEKGPKDPVADKVRAVTEYDNQAKNLATRAMEARSTLVPPAPTSSQVPHLEPDDEPPVVVTSAPSRTPGEAPVSLSPSDSEGGSVPQSVTPERRRSAIPAAAASPGVDERAERLAREAEAFRREQEAEFDQVYDSMADPSDPSVLAAEEARLAQARARSVPPAPADPTNAPPEVRQAAMHAARERARQQATGGIRGMKKRPPHLSAHDAAVDLGADSITPAHTTAKPIGKLEGLDTYRMPTAEVSSRTTRDVGGGPELDAAGHQSVNPKFTGGNPRMRKVSPRKKSR